MCSRGVVGEIQGGLRGVYRGGALEGAGLLKPVCLPALPLLMFWLKPLLQRCPHSSLVPQATNPAGVCSPPPRGKKHPHLPPSTHTLASKHTATPLTPVLLLCAVCPLHTGACGAGGCGQVQQPVWQRGVP
jgi:hypothetical protein